ncbi:unnamed protein product [Effrenium voratum]|uniref:Uncharacterized protein n=1 Tax=Effrenium voratum TaxID=2562239 RepID=A0AA36MLE7_9DINO|nr:unnamed protein product [Effrenium voratum]
MLHYPVHDGKRQARGRRDARRTGAIQVRRPLVCALLAWTICACVAQDPDAENEEDSLDFSIAGEGTVTSTEEVVSGVLLIYGEMDTEMLTTGDMDIVVKETLGKVCKNFERVTGAPTLTKMFVDVRTVGQRRLGRLLAG